MKTEIREAEGKEQPTMKKNWIKLTTAALGTAVLLGLPLTASAETSGYWTMKTDEEGRQVMIYTYTSLDDITYEPVDGMSPTDEKAPLTAEPAAVPDSAQNQRAMEAFAGQSTESVGSLTVIGVLSLVSLAAVLYKIL